MKSLKDFIKLNSIAVRHQDERSSRSFEELYRESVRVFKRGHRSKLSMSGYRNAADADEVFDSAFMRSADKPFLTNFGGLLSKALRNERLYFIRTETRREKRLSLTLDVEPAEDAPTFELVAEDNVEEEVMRKKEADQRQLIDFLVNDPSQVDHDTTLIVSQFKQYDSITALAKALGMHHETVKRKLRKLSYRYDANRFGDVREYLAV